MNDGNKHEFKAALDLAAELAGRAPLSRDALAAYWGLLSDVSIEEFREALRRHQVDPVAGVYFPKPADIIRNLPRAGIKRHGADEAWAIAIGAADESETVIWTDEIAEAWAAAWPIYADGDKIGARVAFRSAYERITSDPSRRPVVQVSQGHDADRRAEVIRDAVASGLLPPSHPAALALPAPESENSVARLIDGTAPMLRLSGPAAAPAAEKARRFAATVRGAIGQREEKQRAARQAEALESRQTTEERRAFLLRQAEELQGRQSRGNAA